MENIPRLLVGLGNPTDKYQKTRHNIGRRFIDHLLNETKSRYEKSRQAEIFRLPAFFNVEMDPPLVCARLDSFMNQSGPALKSVTDKKGIRTEGLLVLVDDFMIPFGSLRIRAGGSSGGHNGLNSIIETFQTEDIPRFRFGIGPTPSGEDPAEFVLKRFSKIEESKLPDLFKVAIEGLEILFKNGLDKAMTFTNKTHLEPV